METDMGFVAKYRAVKGPSKVYERYGPVLLGGVPQATSSVFSHRQDAQTFLEASLENNRGADRPCEGEVVEVTAPLDIIRHCPDVANPIAQAVGAICFHCRQVVKRS